MSFIYFFIRISCWFIPIGYKYLTVFVFSMPFVCIYHARYLGEVLLTMMHFRKAFIQTTNQVSNFSSPSQTLINHWYWPMGNSFDIAINVDYWYLASTFLLDREWFEVFSMYSLVDLGISRKTFSTLIDVTKGQVILRLRIDAPKKGIHWHS